MRRKVQLPLTGAKYTIPNSRRYEIVEHQRVGPGSTTMEEASYAFFPIGDPRENTVFISTKLIDLETKVATQIIEDSRPLKSFLLVQSKPKEPTMKSPELRPGARVKWAVRSIDALMPELGTGTVVYSNAYESTALIYADKTRAEGRDAPNEAEKYCIPNLHSLLLPQNNLVLLKEQGSYDTLKGMPRPIGVGTSRGFKFDLESDGTRLTVQAGKVGRLLSITEAGWALVHWYNWSTRWHQAHSLKVGQTYGRCLAVPFVHLEWCTLGPFGKVEAFWGPGLQQDIRVGDYVIYTHPTPCAIDHASGRRFITKGAILQVDTREDPSSFSIRVVGGCKLDEIGARARIRRSAIAPLTEKFIHRSATVEIVADLEFKKRNLKGRRAVVLLPTDLDGDIGVQFDEDINAGSLDGVGENRKCLYIPASVVKVSE